MHKKILLPTDGSEASEKAGEYVISAANMDDVDLIVLNVVDTDYLSSLPQRDLRKKIEKQLREEGEKIVKKFKKKIEEEQCAGNCKNINIITEIKEGKTVDVILKTANEEDVDQITMSKSGRHSIEKFLLGSTTEKVVRGAKVPVNVIS